MATTQGRTGKGGNITLGGSVVNITGWSQKLNVEFADATDSGNYNAGTGELPMSQLSGASQVEGSIEFNYDASTTSSNTIAKAKNPSAGPYACVLKIDPSTTWFSGNVDLTDVDLQVKVPGATMVSGTANFKSNGAFSLG